MGVIETYDDRTFVESNFYHTLTRYVAGTSKNRVWLYTVDKCEELDNETQEPTGKTIIRIIRWRAKNDKVDKKIKYWKIRSSYNVRSSDEWLSASELVNALLDNDMENTNFVVIPKDEYVKFSDDKTETTDLMTQIRKLKSEKSARNAQLDLFKKRFSLMKSNIKEYEKILADFKALIDRTDSTETEVHQFVEKNNIFWVFGLDYVRIDSKVNFPPGKKDYQFDLMLKRHDNFLDLAELKGPNENLFDKRTSKRNKPNQKLSEALGQVFTYLHACDVKRLKNILKPKSIIVIGKDTTDKIEERRLFSSYLTNVELITYSELYKRGKKLIEYIKSSALI